MNRPEFRVGSGVRNGIMLISHYQHVEDVEGVPFGTELSLRGLARPCRSHAYPIETPMAAPMP
ncbi:hypothetical protein BH23ACT10_BH23ACT10_37700 [soil metagenome]